MEVCLPAQVAITTYDKLGGLNNRLEVLANLVPVMILKFPGLQTASFLQCPHMAEGEGDGEREREQASMKISS